MLEKTENKKYINEILILRAIACLSIVLVHSIGVVQNSIPDLNDYLDITLRDIRLLLTFGTPTFVFISMLLVSYSYPNGLQKKSLVKRFKLIFIPYLSMAVFYAIFSGLVSSLSIKQVFINSSLNIIGNYHGYFVLIILQFYLLAYFFHNYLSKKDPFRVISVSLIINLAYLTVFNFSNPPVNNEIVNYFWARGHWIPFVGWVFYFTLAYYSGKNYNLFLSMLNKNSKYILPSTIIIGALTLASYNIDIIPLSSKSIMMVFFTTSMIGTLYYIATKIKNTPYFLIKVSEYSFSIYLLHFFFFALIDKIRAVLGVDIGIFNAVFLFLGGIIASIFTTYIANKFKIGKYFVGAINHSSAKEKMLHSGKTTPQKPIVRRKVDYGK